MEGEEGGIATTPLVPDRRTKAVAGLRAKPEVLLPRRTERQARCEAGEILLFVLSGLIVKRKVHAIDGVGVS